MSAKASTTTLLVASTHPLWLWGFVHLVESLDTIRIVGLADRAEALCEALERLAPDMVVIDARLVEPARELLGPDYRSPRILVVGSGIHAGTRPVFGPECACGYFSERDAIRQIQTLVDEVARCALPHPGLDACASCTVPRSFRLPPLPLTEREKEIFMHVGHGLGPSEIAAELGVQVKTVEAHREAVKRKLGLASAADLLDAAFAWRDGEPLPQRRAREVDEDVD